MFKEKMKQPKLQFFCVLTTASCVLIHILSLPAFSAGGGIVNSGVETNTNQSNQPNNGNNNNPLQGLVPYQTYSSQFSSYGTNNLCGVNGYLGASYNDGVTPTATTDNVVPSPTNNFSIQAGVIFSPNPCDQSKLQKKQMELDLEKAKLSKQGQENVNCGTQRTQLKLKYRDISKQELDDVCPLGK
jgi:hypothetical protein